MKNVDEGRHFLPDAEEGKRELMITTVLDAEPLQIQRVATPSFIPMLASVTLGGVFILTTYHLYTLALASGAAALATFIWWTWSGTGVIPEKAEKSASLGLKLPLYSRRPRRPWRPPAGRRKT